MIVKLDKIPNQGLELSFSGNEDILSRAISTINLGDLTEMLPSLKGVLRLEPRGKDVLMTGKLEGTLRVQCSRCLERFLLSRIIEPDLVIKRRESVADASDNEETAEPDEILIDGDQVDIGLIIAQELLLETPMKPLCSPDCQGLCPRCGEPRSSGSCRCESGESVDPRWQALLALKTKLTS
jgi:uncharacterized protein